MSIRTELNRPMPLLIEEADFNKKLLVIGRNVIHTQEFLDKGTEPFELAGYTVCEGYSFVKSKHSDQYRLIARNAGGEPITVYAVEVIFRTDCAYPHRSCTQIMVWKTTDPRHDTAVRGLPQYFFEYLLNEHDIVVSDEEQTGAGRRFWQVMLNWAFQTGYHLYIADGTQEDWPLFKIDNMDEFYENWDSFVWGHDADVHKHRRAVISKVDLPHTMLSEALLQEEK
ncbi:hypothetical protein LNQ51_15995 [Yersinia ruckeri]|uniref:hypothetical protein n=1 Tax=Yersinia ruckeri TaxID=29486 RepID=UPI0020BE4858|nr:hypothetical protein [Yersinia ruckeri]MCK8586352.1 hypothetical protein [Yersinia ruckeri]